MALGHSAHQYVILLHDQRAKPATRKEMAQFHTDEYVDFLSRVSPDLIDQAAEGGALGRTQGIARELGKCEHRQAI